MTPRLGLTTPTWADRLALACCIVLAFVVVGVHVSKYPQLSPIDELQHLDYLYKAPTGGIIAQGERVGERALRDEVCRGLDAAFAIPSCDAPAPLDPDAFQERGYNTAYVHPPPYYVVTGVGAHAIEAITGASFHSSARMIGAAWLSLAVWLVWRLLVHRGATPVAQCSLLSLVIVAPSVVFASATASPDATSLLCGAAMLAAVVLWDEGIVPVWALGVAAVFTLGLKFTHVGAIGLAVVFLAVRSAQQAPPAEWRSSSVYRHYGRALAVVLGSAFGALALWTIVQSVLAIEPEGNIPMVQTLRADEFPASQLLEQVDATFSPLQTPYYAPVLRSHEIIGLNSVLDAAVLVAVASVAVFSIARSRERAVGAATAVAMLTLGPVTVLSNYFSSTTVADPIPARYGLPLVPAAVLCAAPALERRWVRVGVAALATVAVALVLQQLIRF